MSLDFIKDIDCSVVVLSTPRTGSTALCKVLSDKCNLIDFSESFNPIQPGSTNFWDYFENDCKTIVKIFPNHQDNLTEDQFNSLIKKSFVIFLDRKDIVNQITSYHILGVTQKAWYTHSETKEEYVVNEDNILKSLITLVELKNKAEKYRQLAHISLCYEDILDDIVNDHIKEYIKPVNYMNIKNKVEQLLPNFLKLKTKYEHSVDG